MKILFIGVFNPESTNVSQSDGFSRIGAHVIDYNYRERARSIGQTARDEEIVQICKDECPNIVFFSKCNEVNIKVVESCNKISTTILWYMDPPGPNIDFELLQKAHHCGYVFAAAWEPYTILKKINPNTYYLQEGFDHIVNKPLDLPKKYNVSFIGSMKYNREPFCNAVGAKTFDSAYGEEHTKVVCQSKINLNFTANAGGTSDRAYKIIACRGFLLTENWPKREDDFVDGKDLVVFNGLEDFKEKVKYYLSHDEEREAIARQGYETVQKFSRIEFAKKILQIVGGTNAAS